MEEVSGSWARSGRGNVGGDDSISSSSVSLASFLFSDNASQALIEPSFFGDGEIGGKGLDLGDSSSESVDHLTVLGGWGGLGEVSGLEASSLVERERIALGFSRGQACLGELSEGTSCGVVTGLFSGGSSPMDGEDLLCFKSLGELRGLEIDSTLMPLLSGFDDRGFLGEWGLVDRSRSPSSVAKRSFIRPFCGVSRADGSADGLGVLGVAMFHTV